MADNKRTKEQVNQEYGQVCAQIGERVFQIGRMQKEVALLSERILELGTEMNKVQSEEKSADVQQQPASGAQSVPVSA